LSLNDKFTNNGRRSVSWYYLLSDSSVQGGMWIVFYCSVLKKADCTMGILMVSLPILLGSVIGAVPVSAQNTVSYDKQNSDIICHQRAFLSSRQGPLSNILNSLNTCVQYCEEILGASKVSVITLFMRKTKQRNNWSYMSFKIVPFAQMQNSASDRKSAGNFPGSHYVKPFSSLPLHCQWSP
jgi:hypothetical protein